MSKEAEKLYKSLVNQCEKINKLIDKGYILLDKDNEICNGKFVFNDRDKKDYIALHKDGSCYWSIFLHRDNTLVFGMNTLLEEYQECKKYLENFKLIPVGSTIRFFDAK